MCTYNDEDILYLIITPKMQMNVVSLTTTTTTTPTHLSIEFADSQQAGWFLPLGVANVAVWISICIVAWGLSAFSL